MAIQITFNIDIITHNVRSLSRSLNKSRNYSVYNDLSPNVYKIGSELHQILAMVQRYGF